MAIILEKSDAYVCDEPKREIAAQDLPERQWLVFSPRFLRPGSVRVGLTAVARDAEGREIARDAVSVPVTVTARGRETSAHGSGILYNGSTASVTLPLPKAAMNKRHHLRVYPNPLSEYLDGVEALLRIPTGCCEQTTSSNYPNIFILDYLKNKPDADPKLVAKATEYVRRGYQRLLSFEVSGGGFSLYGYKPASPWLTAYCLMHLHDLARVIPVDQAVIRRSREFLEKSPLAGEWATYAAWALAETGGNKSFYLTETAVKGLHSRDSSYSRLTGALALLNIGWDFSKIQAVVEQEINRLAKGLYRTKEKLPSSAQGVGAETELIALAILAGQRAEVAVPGVLHEELGRRRSARGGWPGTQATVLALKALIESPQEPCEGTVVVSSGGVELNRHRIDENAESFRLDKPLTDDMQLRYEGTERLSFLVSALGDMRWGDEEMNFNREGLNVRTELDRGETTLGGEMVMTVTLFDHGDGVENPIIEVGLGAACKANPSALEEMVADSNSGVLRYEMRDKGVTLYLTSMPPGGVRHLRIPLMGAHTGSYTLPSTYAWEYYRPENSDTAAGPQISVRQAEFE